MERRTRALALAASVVVAAVATADRSAAGVRPAWVSEGVQTLRSYFRGNPPPRTVSWGTRDHQHARWVEHERWVTVVFPELETCIYSGCLDGPAPINGHVVRRAVTGRRATISWYSGGPRITGLSIKKH
jgi:hypothetical protein